MSSTRSSRARVALITAVLLFLCQAASAAQVCAHAYTVERASDAGMPCHGADGSADAGDGGHAPAIPSGCDAPQAIGDAVKIPACSAAALPALFLASYLPHRIDSAWTQTHAFYAGCPPPLIRLHCRLLN
jgi:hypothetical protein